MALLRLFNAIGFLADTEAAKLFFIILIAGAVDVHVSAEAMVRTMKVIRSHISVRHVRENCRLKYDKMGRTMPALHEPHNPHAPCTFVCCPRQTSSSLGIPLQALREA